MYTVHYLADPNKIVRDHVSNYFDCTEASSREFPTFNSMMAFFDECTRPLSTYEGLCELHMNIINKYSMKQSEKLKNFESQIN